MDTDLRFNIHINKCLQKAYASLKMLYPHRHALSWNLKIKLTDALVSSHFNFCDVVYSPCLDHIYKQKIERVQKSCLRYIYGIRKFERISHKLEDAGWATMEKRRELHSVVLFHKVIYYQTPPYLLNKITFRSDVHTLNLRFGDRISPPPHRTAMFRRCFTWNIYLLYNQLPHDWKQLTLLSFEKNVKASIRTL